MYKSLFLITTMALITSGCGMVFATPTLTPTLENTATIAPTVTPIPPTETPVPTATATEIPLPEKFGPNDFPPQINPLTGLPVSDPNQLDKRPISVKIQFFPRTDRPPFGISSADIVYDYYQNNGLTHVNAIFYSNPAEQVGPIRSGRLLDGAITSMYKSIFVFGGADKKIVNVLFGSDYYDRLLVEGTSNCPPLCRLDPNGLNFLILNAKETGEFMSKKGVPNIRQVLDGMAFEYLPPANGNPATQIYLRYSISAYARWDYDQATGKYLRFQDNQEAMDAQSEGFDPLVDRLTGQQVTADNVVVLLVSHEYTYKSGNSEVIDIKLTGSGKAYAFRDGQMYEVQWTRPSTNSVLSLSYPDGSPFPFKHGTTWFQPVGVSSVVQANEGGTWRFEMLFP